MVYRIIAYISISLFILSSIFLVGCNNKEIHENIIGKWENNGHVYEYKSNGKLYYDSKEMKYEFIDDNKIKIIRDKNDTFHKTVYDYSFNDDGTFTINGVNFFPVS